VCTSPTALPHVSAHLPNPALTELCLLDDLAVSSYTDAHVATGVHELVLNKGAAVTMTPNRAYGALDWLSATLSADETADLTEKRAWSLSNGVATPAATHGGVLYDTLRTAFRTDAKMTSKLAGAVAVHLPPTAALHSGVGGLYGMEGVPVRMQDGSVRVLTHCHHTLAPLVVCIHGTALPLNIRGR
jgi:hypothetical protein